MAKRDKLTQRQKRQVAQKQKQRSQGNQPGDTLGDLSPIRQGLLISRFGEQADVYDQETHETFRCYLRQNLGSPVSGDKVSFRLAANNQGVIEALAERESLLERPSQHQGLKPVVANVEQVFVVVAPLPDFSATLLDRYLVALANARIPLIIIANKWDLQSEIERQSIEQQLAIYQTLGFPLIKLSTKSGLGMDELKRSMRDKRNILVGQSGVGKSSIINRMFPEQHSSVQEVSDNSRLGQHTTTASQLFFFEDNQGFVIDSPGIREFGLWHMDVATVADGFIEFRDYLGSCKFRDCQHTKEPGCAIIAAVEKQQIHPQRWRNYCKIVESSGV